jgi:FkbM family methyltransferase
MKRKLFEYFTSPIVSLFKKANALNVSLLERIGPVYQVNEANLNIKFYCPNNMSLWRAKTLFTKEPDTIEWIKSFSKDEILYDIGANVGMYSIYAAAKNVRVYAFEPESQNYATLNHNIYLNALQDKVNAYNIALSDASCIGDLFIKEFTIGGALNNFGESINYKKEKFNPGFKQSVTSFKLDDLVYQYQLPKPHHIKIDVDGLEHAIITGSSQLLKEPQLKSILVELNTQLAADNSIIGILESYGFKMVSRYRSPHLDHSEFKDIYNYIFRREHALT